MNPKSSLGLATKPTVTDLPILVVGGGPTGLLAANLLGQRGVPVVLVERNATTSDSAKAISLDDESLRVMQLAGLERDVSKIVIPGTGTRYYGASGRPLFHAGGGHYRFGHPFKNPFAQPELERVLREGLARFGHVEVNFSTELTGFEVEGSSVSATVRSAGSNENRVIEASFVLGCDGGRSTVRELMGITMIGRSFDDVWLVADTINDPHDERYGMHFGQPDRPHVIIPGNNGRCRYEFLIRPDEGCQGEQPSFELVCRLVSPYRTLRPEDVERSVMYTFHAVVAERLALGRCFLLGDAAHMMPPFAGQGLNSGIRDAANLEWKIALVRANRANERLLSTYESERRPHAQAIVDLSRRLGQIVMTTSRVRAALRDVAVRACMLTRRGRRYLCEMRFRPHSRFRAGFVLRSKDRSADELIGTAIPQPVVLRGSSYEFARLDDVLGDDFCVLGVSLGDAEWALLDAARLPIVGQGRVDVVLGDRALHDRRSREAIGDTDGRLEEFFTPFKGRFVLVRPDRVIAAIVTALELTALSDWLSPFVASSAYPMESPVDAPESSAGEVDGREPVATD